MRIFISYSRQNAQYVERLEAALQRQGFETWRDTEKLEAGGDWWQSIVDALQSCDALIVVMSPAALNSQWVQREITLAEQLKLPVFPLLLEGENWPIYVRKQYIDVRGDKLPPKDFYNTLRDAKPSSASPPTMPPPSTPKATTPAPQEKRFREFTPYGILVLLLMVCGLIPAYMALFPHTNTPTPTPSLPSLTPVIVASKVPTSEIYPTLTSVPNTSQTPLEENASTTQTDQPIPVTGGDSPVSLTLIYPANQHTLTLVNNDELEANLQDFTFQWYEGQQQQRLPLSDSFQSLTLNRVDASLCLQIISVGNQPDYTQPNCPADRVITSFRVNPFWTPQISNFAVYLGEQQIALCNTRTTSCTFDWPNTPPRESDTPTQAADSPP